MRTCRVPEPTCAALSKRRSETFRVCTSLDQRNMTIRMGFARRLFYIEASTSHYQEMRTPQRSPTTRCSQRFLVGVTRPCFVVTGWMVLILQTLAVGASPYVTCKRVMRAKCSDKRSTSSAAVADVKLERDILERSTKPRGDPLDCR